MLGITSIILQGSFCSLTKRPLCKTKLLIHKFILLTKSRECQNIFYLNFHSNYQSIWFGSINNCFGVFQLYINQNLGQMDSIRIELDHREILIILSNITMKIQQQFFCLIFTMRFPCFLHLSMCMVSVSSALVKIIMKHTML